MRNENPKHMSSKSWPSDHLGNELQTLPSKDSQNRQSWHSQEPTDKHDQPSKTGPTGLKCSSSVVIRSVRTSTSSSTSEDTSFKPKIYRTASLELQPPADTFEGNFQVLNSAMSSTLCYRNVLGLYLSSKILQILEFPYCTTTSKK